MAGCCPNQSTPFPQIPNETRKGDVPKDAGSLKGGSIDAGTVTFCYRLCENRNRLRITEGEIDCEFFVHDIDAAVGTLCARAQSGEVRRYLQVTRPMVRRLKIDPTHARRSSNEAMKMEIFLRDNQGVSHRPATRWSQTHRHTCACALVRLTSTSASAATGLAIGANLCRHYSLGGLSSCVTAAVRRTQACSTLLPLQWHCYA